MSALDAFRLDGQVAFLNGAGRGIGAACAVAIADAGADVAIRAYERHELDETADLIARTGRRVEIFEIGPEHTDEVRALNAAAERLGGLSILVNVAGGAPPGELADLTDAAVHAALDLNLALPLRLTRAAVPHMRARGGGSVVNVSSAMARLVAPGFVLYGAAKAALEHATRLLAADLAPDIRVNAVAPGAVLTRGLQRFVERAGGGADSVAGVPLGRLADPADVAHAVLYLVSPAAAYITGTVLSVDGGIQAPVFGAAKPGSG